MPDTVQGECGWHAVSQRRAGVTDYIKSHARRLIYLILWKQFLLSDFLIEKIRYEQPDNEIIYANVDLYISMPEVKMSTCRPDSVVGVTSFHAVCVVSNLRTCRIHIYEQIRLHSPPSILP